MKILITGANGFIGSHLCAALGNEAIANRLGSAPQLIKCSRRQIDGDFVVVGDIVTYPDWVALMQGVDIVIHLAGRVHQTKETIVKNYAPYHQDNVQATQTLLQAAKKAGVAHFIFLSTVAVMGYESSQPLPATNTAPYNDYSISKLEAEKLVRGSEVRHTIIRIPLTYGAGVKANFASLMRMVERGLPLPFGLVNNARSLLYIGNLTDAIIQLLSLENKPELLLLADKETPSNADLVRLIAGAMGKPARLLPIPKSLISLAAKLLGKPLLYHQLCSSLVMDCEPSYAALNWQPPLSQAESINQLICYSASKR
jgi:nucleoside-diphosphate-sugar epimerase